MRYDMLRPAKLKFELSGRVTREIVQPDLPNIQFTLHKIVNESGVILRSTNDTQAAKRYAAKHKATVLTWRNGQYV